MHFVKKMDKTFWKIKQIFLIAFKYCTLDQSSGLDLDNKIGSCPFNRNALHFLHNSIEDQVDFIYNISVFLEYRISLNNVRGH